LHATGHTGEHLVQTTPLQAPGEFSITSKALFPEMPLGQDGTALAPVGACRHLIRKIFMKEREGN
jgi:hypothetical protein